MPALKAWTVGVSSKKRSPKSKASRMALPWGTGAADGVEAAEVDAAEEAAAAGPAEAAAGGKRPSLPGRSTARNWRMSSRRWRAKGEGEPSTEGCPPVPRLQMRQPVP